MYGNEIDIKDYTSAALWRKPEQLRGLVKNHPDVIRFEAPLNTGDSLLFSSHIALHSSDHLCAVGVAPVVGTSAIHLFPIDEDIPCIRSCSTAQQLFMPDGLTVTSLQWHSETLLVGVNRGRVLLSSQGVGTTDSHSGALQVSHTLTTGQETKIGETFSSPSAYASCTGIRSLAVHPTSALTVAGVCGSRAYVWDASESRPLCEWGRTDNTAPLMFTRWVTDGSNVMLTGAYGGAVSLVDIREGMQRQPSGKVSFFASSKSAAVSAAFNPILPYVFALASADGMLSVYDIRFTKELVHYIPSHQGSLTGVQWMGLHSDLICTSGVDGSVGMWCLRCPPTFSVGRAEYRLPLMDLVTTTTSLRESALGVSLGGDVIQTALKSEAMVELGLLLASGHVDDTTGDAGKLLQEEREAYGSMYTRQVARAMDQLANSAEARLERNEIEAALKLVELSEDFTPQDVSFPELVSTTAASMAEQNSRSFVQEAFSEDVVRSSSQLPSVLRQRSIRSLRTSNPQAMRRLASVHLNARLRLMVQSRRLEDIFAGIPRTLHLLSSNAELFDYIDMKCVSDIVSFACHTDIAEGERLVKILLNFLESMTSTPKSSTLIRLVMNTAQEPLVTAGANTKQSRRLEENFYRELTRARDAVLTQLRVLALGVDNYAEVIELVEKYQESCIQAEQPGIFGWLSVKALVVYLHCVAADRNYVTLFWTGVQLLETFSSLPGAYPVEQTIFAVVDRIFLTGKRDIPTLYRFAELRTFNITQLKEIRRLLRRYHAYITAILRVQLECENVAVDSGMRELPPVMEKILDVLISSTEKTLTAWATLMESLMVCPQKKHIRLYCLPLVQKFSFEVEKLIVISAKGENDDCLNEILETCDDFMAALGAQ